MDQLEAAGIVGPSAGSKPREVLMLDLLSLENYFKSNQKLNRPLQTLSKCAKNTQRMRLILSTIIGLFFFTAVSTAQNNPQAEEVLDNVSNFYSNFYSFTGTFVMKIENEEADISEIQEGEYWVMGDKYRLESKMLDRVTDGETVWTILKKMKNYKLPISIQRKRSSIHLRYTLFIKMVLLTPTLPIRFCMVDK